MNCVCGHGLQYRIQAVQELEGQTERFSIQSKCSYCNRVSEAEISSEINEVYESICDRLSAISKVQEKTMKPMTDLVFKGIIRDILSLRAEPVVLPAPKAPSRFARLLEKFRSDKVTK
ncbi:hypothetical protein PSTEL_13185 [Paenibacillus stellifer]|uniref:Uncharacterized protein n=1 Tax=Paenibacillus stellifer TaxID=169760 RepID=A0A089N5C0_9BACL|nr:hypothetical protein PSTEL_13185 [Paenibacillus stellifer]